MEYKDDEFQEIAISNLSKMQTVSDLQGLVLVQECLVSIAVRRVALYLGEKRLAPRKTLFE